MEETTPAQEPEFRFLTNFPNSKLPIYEMAIQQFPGYEIRESEPGLSGHKIDGLHSIWYSGSDYTDDFWDYVLSLEEALK